MTHAISATRTWAAAMVLCAMLPCSALAAAASRPSPMVWVTPVIAGYGKVHPRPDAAVQPEPSVDYRVFVRVTDDGKHPRDAMPALDRVARLVNLMGVSKVPPSHVHIVALLDGEAALAAATDATYRDLTKVARNPNLPLIHALKKAGVELLVCSQALASKNLPDSAVVPDATVTLSALTDAVVYGQKGYSLMQL